MNMKKYNYMLIIFFLGNIILNNNLYSQNKSNLKLDVSGFKNSNGTARIIIFNSQTQKGFPDNYDLALDKKIVPIINNKVLFEFKDLPFGEYAITVHHDENNDMKVNKNFFGIPKEGLGCTNDAKGNFGPPSYEQAKVNFRIKNQTYIINIVN